MRPRPVYPDTTTHLCCQTRSRIEGAVGMYYYDVYAQWSGKGSLTWQTEVAAAGQYELALCCSVLVKAVRVEVSAGGTRIAATVKRTWGVWPEDGHPEYNFERVPLAGRIRLPEGPVTLTVTVKDALPENAFNLFSLELTPVAAKKAVARIEVEGLKYRSKSDWFADSGYGLMFHWGPGTQRRRGKPLAWDTCGRRFDVNAWADMCADTGAAYAFLTANHGDPYFPGPLPYWEKTHPGWTMKRDLIADMAEALEARGLRLCLYLNCPTFGQLGKRRSIDAYFEANRRMFQEVGTRYGEHAAAYWLDSWYQPYVRWGRFPMQEMFKATKAGYRDRFVGFNHWAFPVPSRCQDYWTAEVYQSMARPPESRVFKRGAARGLQYHALYSIDCHWGVSSVKGVPKPIWSPEVFGEYILKCMAKRGVVTANLAIYQDGAISPKTARMMRHVRRIVRG